MKRSYGNGLRFQRVRVLAVKHELTPLVMHRRPRGYDARASLRCQRNDFELGIERVPRMHLLLEPARGARKRKKHVAEVLRKEGGTRGGEGKNLQSMHHGSRASVSARVLHVVVNWMIVSRNRLESGGMRVRWPQVRVRVTEDVTARLLARVGQGELDL